MTGETLAELRGTEVEMVRTSAKYLVGFMIGTFSLELLDLIFRGYTTVKSWDILRYILRSVIYHKDWVDIFIKQYLCGYVIPFILHLWPRLTVRRAAAATLLVLFGVS